MKRGDRFQDLWPDDKKQKWVREKKVSGSNLLVSHIHNKSISGSGKRIRYEKIGCDADAVSTVLQGRKQHSSHVI